MGIGTMVIIEAEKNVYVIITFILICINSSASSSNFISISFCMIIDAQS